MEEVQQFSTPELAFEHWHQKVHSGLRTTLEAAWYAGKALEEIKASRDHGTFGTWLEKQGVASRTAQRYMELARAFPSNPLPMSHLSGGIVGTLKALKPDKRTSIAAYYHEAQSSARKAGKAAWELGRNLTALHLELAQEPVPDPRFLTPVTCPGYSNIEDLKADATNLAVEPFIEQYVERFTGSP